MLGIICSIKSLHAARNHMLISSPKSNITPVKGNRLYRRNVLAALQAYLKRNKFGFRDAFNEIQASYFGYWIEPQRRSVILGKVEWHGRGIWEGEINNQQCLIEVMTVNTVSCIVLISYKDIGGHTQILQHLSDWCKGNYIDRTISPSADNLLCTSRSVLHNFMVNGHIRWLCNSTMIQKHAS